MTGQPQILDGLLRVPTATIVMCEVTVVVAQTRPIQSFQRLARPLVLRFALLVEYRAIRYVLGQRVLEEILHLGKRRLFIQKLFALQGR